MDLLRVAEFNGNATSFAVAPGENNSIYICLQQGLIYKFNLNLNKFVGNVFLDLSKEIKDLYQQKPMKIKFADERGLLRLAFHPEYNVKESLFEGVFIVMHSQLANKQFFTNKDNKETPNPDHMTCISQYKYTPGNTAKDTKNTRMDVMCIPEPEANHNGGALVFGPDGYLWIGLGDGGGANDEHGKLLTKDSNSFIGNAQNLQSLHGKILRIEIVQPMKQTAKYNVPKSNPFVGNNKGRNEIVAWGFRNPWSISIDSNGTMFVGDVGQNRKESIKIVKIGGNYGWRATEGDEVFNLNVINYIKKTKQTITQPILSYPRKNGVAITGVNLYEGNRIPYLKNILVFVDYSGSIMLAKKINQVWKWNQIKKVSDVRFSGMGTDAFGESYILGFDFRISKGVLLRIVNVNSSYIPRAIKQQRPVLTEKDLKEIIYNGVQMATEVKSGLRKDSDGNPTHTKMHFAIICRGDQESTLVHSMKDAWEGSKDIAKRKANTAMSFSSDQNALTSRTVGFLSQPGKPLWHIGNSNPKGGIIEFPGGIPLYKNGYLVGGVGVSGDGVDQDETVAMGAVKGFEAPNEIKSDVVINVAYTGNPADKLIAPGTSKESPRPIILIGREEWNSFKSGKDMVTPIILFISGDRTVTDLIEFIPHANQFISINFFATKLSSLEGINKFVNLKSLNVSRSMITDSDLVHLKNMTQLTRLELNGNDITNINDIKDLVNLRKLGLACTFIHDLPIEKMLNLKILDLYQTPLKSDIIPKIKDIEDVDIRKTNIEK